MIHHINKIDCVNRFLTERKKIKKGGSPFFFQVTELVKEKKEGRESYDRKLESVWIIVILKSIRGINVILLNINRFVGPKLRWTVDIHVYTLSLPSLEND